MNSQNSTNFQQFVTSNKGKKITFEDKYNKVLSKFVVDVCSDYFTCKNNESDAKIDGFYYFNDCKLIDNRPELARILENYEYCIVLSKHKDFIGKYVCSLPSNRILFEKLKTSKDLHSNTTISVLNSSIKQIWTIIDDKYTKIFEQSDSDTELDSDNCSSSLNSTIEATVESTKIDSESKGLNLAKDVSHFCSYKKHADEWFAFDDDYDISKYLKYPEIFYEIMNKLKNEEFSKDLYNRLIHMLEEIKSNISINIKKIKYDTTFQTIVKTFVELINKCRTNDETNEGNELLDKINNFIKSTSIKQTKNKFCDYPKYPIKIEYRNKPKTVQIVSEYVSNNKIYLLVKDLTDSNKTKTFFKDYVKFLDDSSFNLN